MIYTPNNKSILQKILEFREKYYKDHGVEPNVIYLDPDERKDLKLACKIVEFEYPVHIFGMLMKNAEDRKEEGG
jgi:hypothetical protein